MKQVLRRTARPRPNQRKTAALPAPLTRHPRTNNHLSSTHAAPNRPRGIHKRTRRSPKLKLQNSTSASASHLQTQLPILQSQEYDRQICFPQAPPASAARSLQPQLAAHSCEGSAGDIDEYLSSIGEHLFRQESRSPVPPMAYSEWLDHPARVASLQLIYSFSSRYGFKEETTFLAFSIYHRVAFAPLLAHLPPSLHALASLFVAAKYEEIAIPKAEVFARCDPALRAGDILRVESQILLLLNFNLSFPNVLQFIDLLLVRYNLGQSARRRLIEICYKSLNSLPLWQERGSFLAMACLHVLTPDLDLGQSRSQDLQAELKWRVAELMRVGVVVHPSLA